MPPLEEKIDSRSPFGFAVRYHQVENAVLIVTPSVENARTFALWLVNMFQEVAEEGSRVSELYQEAKKRLNQ